MTPSKLIVGTMEGEGMLAMVRGLGDAGLAVTLLHDNREYTLTPREGIEGNHQCCHPGHQARRLINRHTTPATAALYVDSGAQAVDARYTTTYQSTHCHIKPTSPIVEATEFPPQRPVTTQGNSNFIVGGHGSRQMYQPVKSTAYRGGMAWPDRGSVCTPRPAEKLDSFASSLRRYPGEGFPSERSTEIFERLVKYSSDKFLNKPYPNQAQTKYPDEVQRQYNHRTHDRHEYDDHPTKDCTRESENKYQENRYHEGDGTYQKPKAFIHQPTGTYRVLNSRQHEASTTLDTERKFENKTNLETDRRSENKAPIEQERRFQNKPKETDRSFENNASFDVDRRFETDNPNIWYQEPRVNWHCHDTMNARPDVGRCYTSSNRPVMTHNNLASRSKEVQAGIKTVSIETETQPQAQPSRRTIGLSVSSASFCDILSSLHAYTSSKCLQTSVSVLTFKPVLSKNIEQATSSSFDIQIEFKTVFVENRKTKSDIVVSQRDDESQKGVLDLLEEISYRNKNERPIQNQLVSKEFNRHDDLVGIKNTPLPIYCDCLYNKGIKDRVNNLRDKLLQFFENLNTNLCEKHLVTLRNTLTYVVLEAVEYDDRIRKKMEYLLQDYGNFTKRESTLMTNNIACDLRKVLNDLNRSRSITVCHGAITSRDENNNASAKEKKDINADQYIHDISEKINEWLNSLNIVENEDSDLRQEVIYNLARDIYDRHVYLNMKPELNTTEEDELNFLKYLIFKWANKLTDENDLTTIDRAQELRDMVNTVLIPTTTETMDGQKGPSITPGAGSSKTPCCPDEEIPCCQEKVQGVLHEDLDEYLKQWVQKLPTNDKLRAAIYNGIWKAITKLNCDPERSSNRYYYEDILDDDIDKLYNKHLSKNKDLEKLQGLKTELIVKVIEQNAELFSPNKEQIMQPNDNQKSVSFRKPQDYDEFKRNMPCCGHSSKMEGNIFDSNTPTQYHADDWYILPQNKAATSCHGPPENNRNMPQNGLQLPGAQTSNTIKCSSCSNKNRTNGGHTYRGTQQSDQAELTPEMKMDFSANHNCTCNNSQTKPEGNQAESKLLSRQTKPRSSKEEPMTANAIGPNYKDATSYQGQPVQNDQKRLGVENNRNLPHDGLLWFPLPDGKTPNATECSSCFNKNKTRGSNGYRDTPQSDQTDPEWVSLQETRIPDEMRMNFSDSHKCTCANTGKINPGSCPQQQWTPLTEINTPATANTNIVPNKTEYSDAYRGTPNIKSEPEWLSLEETKMPDEMRMNFSDNQRQPFNDTDKLNPGSCCKQNWTPLTQINTPATTNTKTVPNKTEYSDAYRGTPNIKSEPEWLSLEETRMPDEMRMNFSDNQRQPFNDTDKLNPGSYCKQNWTPLTQINTPATTNTKTVPNKTEYSDAYRGTPNNKSEPEWLSLEETRMPDEMRMNFSDSQRYSPDNIGKFKPGSCCQQQSTPLTEMNTPATTNTNKVPNETGAYNNNYPDSPNNESEPEWLSLEETRMPDEMRMNFIDSQRYSSNNNNNLKPGSCCKQNWTPLSQINTPATTNTNIVPNKTEYSDAYRGTPNNESEPEWVSLQETRMPDEMRMNFSDSQRYSSNNNDKLKPGSCPQQQWTPLTEMKTPATTNTNKFLNKTGAYSNHYRGSPNNESEPEWVSLQETRMPDEMRMHLNSKQCQTREDGNTQQFSADGNVSRQPTNQNTSTEGRAVPSFAPVDGIETNANKSIQTRDNLPGSRLTTNTQTQEAFQNTIGTTTPNNFNAEDCMTPNNRIPSFTPQRPRKKTQFESDRSDYGRKLILEDDSEETDAEDLRFCKCKKKCLRYCVPMDNDDIFDSFLFLPMPVYHW